MPLLHAMVTPSAIRDADAEVTESAVGAPLKLQLHISTAEPTQVSEIVNDPTASIAWRVVAATQSGFPSSIALVACVVGVAVAPPGGVAGEGSAVGAAEGAASGVPGVCGCCFAASAR